MSSKILCFLAALLSLLLVSAAIENNKDDKKPEAVETYRCRFGCCGGFGRYGCTRCCAANEYVMVQEPDQLLRDAKNIEGGGGGGGWGGGGGGGGWGGGRGGGGGGGGCRRCCGWHEGHCYRCCSDNVVPKDAMEP